MRPRVRFFGWLVVLAVTLIVICACEPVQMDGWEHYAAARDPSSFDGLAAFAKQTYLHGNPRWGQIVLAWMFHFHAIAIVVTPLVIIGTLLASMTLIRGRAPRPGDPRDLALLVQVLATTILATPSFGTIWFYRPNCANYLYPLLVQLVWLIPYRCLAVRAVGRSTWLGLAIVPLGLLAGAGNEHTGIGLALAGGGCIVLAWRRDGGVPPWAFLGVAALAIGYAVVLTAPGQMVRYNGLGALHSPIERIAIRGVLGNLRTLGSLVAWLCPILVVAAAVAGRSVGGGWLARAPRRTMVAGVAIAAVILASSLAAPRVPPRMLVAPATLVALALGVFLVELATHRGKARRLQIVSIAISAIALAATLAIFVVTGCESRARQRRLADAPPGSVVCVTPYTFSSPTPFTVGDDLRNTSLAKRVARMFGLDGIRVATRSRPCTSP